MEGWETGNPSIRFGCKQWLCINEPIWVGVAYAVWIISLKSGEICNMHVYAIEQCLISFKY